MKLKIPKDIEKIVDKFKQKNFQLYLVGGALRDFFLNREITDWDFTTDSKPEEILKLFPNAYYNNKFGTVGVLVGDATEGSRRRARSDSEDGRRDTEAAGPTNNNGIVEITTMRREGEYKDSRHPDDIEWTNKIEEDLNRRDFTINSMAYDLSSDQVVDPFDGQADLEKQLIKAVGDPDKRFQEDALRLIRAVRFATQLNFNIDDETKESIKQNAKLIEQISRERIRDELFKILSTKNPRQGIELLREVDLLQYILPELERCFGVKQEGPKHDRIYDIGEHSLSSLKHCPSDDPIIRFAALIHDIGKPDTYKISKEGNVTFYHHEVVGEKIAEKIADRLHLSKEQKQKVVNLVRWHLFTVDENQTDSAIRRFIKNIGLQNIEDIMAIREADRLGGGSTPTSWRTEKFKERIKQVLDKPFSISDLKVTGHDVMEVLDIPPSRKIGEILEKLFAEISEDQAKNTQEYLLGRIKQLESVT